MSEAIRLAVVGGGPSALLIFKRLLERGDRSLKVTLFERKPHLGRGMPYDDEGANREHVTNVSSNELPELAQSLTEWIASLPQAELDEFGLRREQFSEDHVLPRLLFGRYLEAQFAALRGKAEEMGITVRFLLGCEVTDIWDLPEQKLTRLRFQRSQSDGAREESFERVVVCSGHHWPHHHEPEVPGYFDSPYPPAKLARTFNHPVALRGSSLTAIDALRTLAAANGRFEPEGDRLRFVPSAGSEKFRLVMHTRNGMLPCVRFHLEDPQVTEVELYSDRELAEIRARHDGFVPLDLVFDDYFKKLLREKNPQAARRVEGLNLEEVVELAMTPREQSDPFDYFAEECREAELSLAERRTVAWKEVLAVLSFALNYPAKYFSAEDSLRLKKVLQPLISIVIAFIPRSSAAQLLALHQAGCLQLLSVDEQSKVEPCPEGGVEYHLGEGQSAHYATYVDCVGQPPLPLEAIPFPTLVKQGGVSQARLAFRSADRGREHQQKHPDAVEQDQDGSFHLLVPGLAINDDFRPLNRRSEPHPRLAWMAVPYMGGHNPDYSGLDFCEEASERIVKSLLKSSAAPENAPASAG